MEKREIEDMVIEAMPIRLMGNRVLVALVPVKSRSERAMPDLVLAGNISDQKKVKSLEYDIYPFQGIVVGVGDKVGDDNIKVGDLVYLDSWVDINNFDREGFLFQERGYACVRDMQITAVVKRGITVKEYNSIIGEVNRIKRA